VYICGQVLSHIEMGNMISSVFISPKGTLRALPG